MGRIVIPKEIRRMLAIRDGENLEIAIDNENIILKKYNYLQNIADLGTKLINIYNTVSENKMIITDREKIVACNYDKNLINMKNEIKLLNAIDGRNIINMRTDIAFESYEINGYIVAVPIINEVDCIGLVLIFNEEEKIIEKELNVAKIFSKILAEKLNIS